MASVSDFGPGGNVATYTMAGAPARDGTYPEIGLQWVRPIEVRGVETFASSSPTVEFEDSRSGRTVKRALFTFDFRARNEGQAPQMQHVRAIQSAKITLNIASVIGVTKIYLAETTSNPRGLTVENARTTSIKGAPPILSRDPQIDREMMTQNITIRRTGLVTWELPGPMKAGLRRALINKTFYTIIALDFRDTAQSVVTARDSGGGTERVGFSDFSSSSTAPKLNIAYTLNEDRFYIGGGNSRISKAGFAISDIYSGTNAGFSS